MFYQFPPQTVLDYLSHASFFCCSSWVWNDTDWFTFDILLGCSNEIIDLVDMSWRNGLRKEDWDIGSINCLTIPHVELKGIDAVAIGSQTMKQFSGFTPLFHSHCCSCLPTHRKLRIYPVFQGWDQVISLSTELPRTFSDAKSPDANRSVIGLWQLIGRLFPCGLSCSLIRTNISSTVHLIPRRLRHWQQETIGFFFCLPVYINVLAGAGFFAIKKSLSFSVLFRVERQAAIYSRLYGKLFGILLLW